MSRRNNQNQTFCHKEWYNNKIINFYYRLTLNTGFSYKVTLFWAQHHSNYSSPGPPGWGRSYKMGCVCSCWHKSAFLRNLVTQSQCALLASFSTWLARGKARGKTLYCIMVRSSGHCVLVREPSAWTLCWANTDQTPHTEGTFWMSQSKRQGKPSALERTLYWATVLSERCVVAIKLKFLAEGKLPCVFFVILSCAVAFFQTLQHSLTSQKQIKVEC